MFTGIIQEVAKIKRIEQKGAGRVIILDCCKMQSELSLGASIACDGTCLTVIDFDAKEVRVEVMPETIRNTTIKQWYPGYSVNLERALRADSGLDGHIVQGHIDCSSNVLKVSRKGDSQIIEIELPVQFSSLVVEKGSIAVNGVSLTVASLSAFSFNVALIGFTFRHTNLSALSPGKRVNLEFDIIGKYVNRYLAGKQNPVPKDVFYG